MVQIMKIYVRRWGNSVGVRIPQVLAKQAGVVDGTEMDMNVVKGEIVLSKPKISLNNLLEKVHEGNIHVETDTGSVNGKEIW